MPTVFSSPTSGPITIGDGYTLYKRSTIPVVPKVDDTEKETPVEEKEEEKDGSEDKELDGKRKADAETQGGAEGEAPEPKKQKQKESISNSEASGSDTAKDAETSAGGTAPDVRGESHGDESKVGDKSGSVPTEPERNHPKQETKQEDTSGQV